MLFSIAIAGVKFPTPTEYKYINDYTETISKDVIEKIVSIGKELEEKTTAELTIVIIHSLEGLSVEEYANQLFRKWGIGQKGKDNGVLFLVALKDRQMRIEIGYGLEGAITDGEAGRIRDEYIIPYFKEMDYSKGVYYGYLALAQKIAEEYTTELNINFGELPKVRQRLELPEKVQIIVGPILFLVIMGIIIWMIVQIFKRIIDFILYDLLHKPPSSRFKKLKNGKLDNTIKKVHVFKTSARALISGSAHSVFGPRSRGISFGGGRSGGGGASGKW